MLTEQQNPNSSNLDQLNSLELVQRINAEDQTVAQVVQVALPAVAQAVDGIVARLKQGGRVLYIGAGTSGRLGVLDAVECVPTFSASPELIQGIVAGGNRALTQSVEGAEDDAAAGAHALKQRDLQAVDAVVGIAASGRTPYVLGALAYAQEVGALRVGIACNVPSPVLDAAEVAIGLPVGPEIITGSTRMKAGTAQKMVLNMLSTASMVQVGKVYGNLMVDVQVTNEKLAQRARRIVMQLTGLDEAAAAQLLGEAGQHVKTAVVMHQRGVSRDEARRLLAEADGFLRAIIG